MPVPQTARPSTAAAAVRHVVYRDLVGLLPHASYDQACRFAANLRLVPPEQDAARRERRLNTVLMRFISLRVTPDACEVRNAALTADEIARELEQRHGERLAAVAGFYRREPGGPFYLDLPRGCAAYAYGSGLKYRRPSLVPGVPPPECEYIAGVLLQPLSRIDSFFLLSSARHGGPRAQPLTATDRNYFERNAR